MKKVSSQKFWQVPSHQRLVYIQLSISYLMYSYVIFLILFVKSWFYRSFECLRRSTSLDTCIVSHVFRYMPQEIMFLAGFSAYSLHFHAF